MYMTKLAAISAAALLLAGCEAQQAQNNAAPQVEANAAQQAQFTPRPKGPDHKIILVWKKDKNEWKVKLSATGLEETPDKAITKLNKDDGPSMFEVQITGDTPATFKDPGGLDVWEGANAKAKPQTGINSYQILGPVITKKGTLVFWHMNLVPGVTVNYRLNFDNGVISVDPIIEN